MLSVIDELPSVYDEPVAEPSQLAVFILAREARKQVKVVLTGDGGDELFGGYAWYERFRRSWFIRDSLPRILRRPLASAMRVAGNSRTVSSAVGLASPRLEDILATRPHKLTAVLEADSPGELYYQLRSEWPNAEDLVLGNIDGTSRRNPYRDSKLCFSDMRLAGSYWDLATFLPEHPLAKVDRATMAVGLEARVPLLGRPVVEFALRLPAAQRIGRRSTKLLLRSVLHRYVPPSLVEHPKIGFEVPVGEWLRGPLRRWGAELLDPARLQAEGHLDVALVARTWDEHVSGERDHSRRLWSVLVFQAWLETQNAKSQAPSSSVAG
jgi:asparagine synthase (glutamine-hydrolysing)